MTDSPECLAVVARLQNEIEELRVALSGRTVSCESCNQNATRLLAAYEEAERWKAIATDLRRMMLRSTQSENDRGERDEIMARAAQMMEEMQDE